MTLQEKFLAAIAMVEGAADNPVRDHVLALFVQDQGWRVGLIPRSDLLRNLRTLDPFQQHSAASLLADARRLLEGPTDPQP